MPKIVWIATYSSTSMKNIFEKSLTIAHANGIKLEEPVLLLSIPIDIMALKNCAEIVSKKQATEKSIVKISTRQLPQVEAHNILQLSSKSFSNAVFSNFLFS